MRNTKLKTIAVLGLVTICSSLGASTIDANAGGFLSKSTNTTTSSGSGGFFNRLSKGIPQVELALPKLGLGKTLRNGWKNFKGLFTSSSSKADKTSRKGPVNPTGEPVEVIYASLTINGKPGSGIINGGFDGNNEPTIYTTVRGTPGTGANPNPVNQNGQSLRFEVDSNGLERVILND